MIYRVEITEQAEADLRGIYEYIAFSLLSPQSAKSQLERLEEKILKLDRMPQRFKKYEKEPWHGRGLRQMPVDNFVVFYTPNEAESKVTVIRVLYGGCDIDTELRENTSV
ncbi:MAG: type II toxin-antitoxin system RelE/ParE family toxin [Acutalibacteraceae bacterium]